jgi:hypothetical protein
VETFGGLLHRNVQRFRGGLVFKAHRLCASIRSRPESNKEEERGPLRYFSRGPVSGRVLFATTLLTETYVESRDVSKKKWSLC